MATRNFVPRADGEGSIGTEAKNWGNGFFKKAAIGALTKTVSVLVPADDANDQQPATTSWVRARFRSILETVLSAAGLKYNIASNGYICFGALFGNLILQWGIVNVTPYSRQLIEITTPTSRTSFEILAGATTREWLEENKINEANSIHLVCSDFTSLDKIKLLISNPTSGTRGWWKWIILCK